MADVSVGDLYENRAASQKPRAFDTNAEYSCHFCESVTLCGDKLEKDETTRVHAAAHRIAFECLMENNPLLICPICEVPIVSDEGILTKTHEALFNDRDLVRHLQMEHFQCLLEDFADDFGRLSYLLTTFVANTPAEKDFANDEKPSTSGAQLKTEKPQSKLPVSIIHCESCSWHSLKEGPILSSSCISSRVKAHLMKHIETGFNVKTDEEVLMWQAEMGALKMHFFSATGESTDISAFPYAERLVPVYTKQLVQCFGICYPLVMRVLHGLRGNPFKSKKVMNALALEYQPEAAPPNLHRIGRGNPLVSRLMRDYRVSQTALIQKKAYYQKFKTKKPLDVTKCGRVECGYSILDFTDTDKAISHVFAHIRHDEARLSRALEGVCPLICKCGVQIYSPVGLLYHVCNEHIFDADAFAKDSHQECSVKMATYIISSYSQTIILGRQKCRDKCVITEWMARMGMEEGIGAEEQWAMVDVPIAQAWSETWKKFVDGVFTEPEQLDSLFTILPFEAVEKQFVDPAKPTYQIIPVEDSMNRMRRMFARLANTSDKDNSKWFIHKRLQRDEFERLRTNQKQVRRYHKYQRVREKGRILRKMAIIHPGAKVTITTPNLSPVNSENVTATEPDADPEAPSTSHDASIQVEMSTTEFERASRESSTMDSQDPLSNQDDCDDVESESVKNDVDGVTENMSVIDVPVLEDHDSTDSDTSLPIDTLRAKSQDIVKSEDVIQLAQAQKEIRKLRRKVALNRAVKDKRTGLTQTIIENALSTPRLSSIEKIMAVPKNSANKATPLVSRVHCKTCTHTSFAKDDLHMQKMHAAAHAVLLFRITSPMFIHGPDGISCPACTADINKFYSPMDFDVASMIRHLMRRHADAILKVYSDYLEEKFPIESFTVTESEEFNGKLVLRCCRGGCGSNKDVFSIDISTPIMSHREADVPVLKHLLWHIRNDKGLVDEPSARELLTRVLMSRMALLNEKNLLVHAFKSVTKYPKERQMEYIKYICAQVRRVVCAVFGEDAAWVLQMVLPSYSGRKVLPILYSQCICLQCKIGEKREARSLEFGWDPISASLHAIAHYRVTSSDTKALPDFATNQNFINCLICENSFSSKIEAMFHMLSVHTEIVSTGLLYPLFISMDCVEEFSKVLELSFESESWQIKQTFSFPDQHPRHMPLIIRAIPVPSEKKKRTKSMTEKSPLKKNKVELSVSSSSSSDLPDVFARPANFEDPKKQLKGDAKLGGVLSMFSPPKQQPPAPSSSSHDMVIVDTEDMDMSLTSAPTLEDQQGFTGLFVKEEPEEYAEELQQPMPPPNLIKKKPNLAEVLDRLKNGRPSNGYGI